MSFDEDSVKLKFKLIYYYYCCGCCKVGEENIKALLTNSLILSLRLLKSSHLIYYKSKQIK